MTKIDKLDRQNFIKFVENLIVNSDNYKRNNDSDAYVMALNSAWGTGKSYFLDLFIQDIKENEKINVVKYNAWENDYCDNAFNPLMYDILNADCLKFSTETDADIQNAKKLLKSAFNVGKVFTKGLINEAIKNKTGIDVEKALDEAIKSSKDFKSFMFREIPNLQELNEQRDAFNELKTYLSNATEWMQEHDSKLVVIIDELDRCKPTFAIQTLEIVKHIFDVKNIVFLFAVDIEQLSHSISSVYGQGFDSVGYLCRFFDYIAKMPAPNIKQYIIKELSEIETIKDEKVDSYRNEGKPCLLIEDVAEYLTLLYKDFNLSLRDLDTVLKNYRIMLDNFLFKYSLSLSHIIYLFFLTLKYKKPAIFNEIFIKKSGDHTYEGKYGEVARFDSIKIIPVHCASTHVLIEKTLSELKESIHCTATGKQLSSCLQIYDVNDKNIIFTKSGSMMKTSMEIDPGTNYGNLLFGPDFKEWEKIKDYTYGEYIHKQLENYNFTYDGTDEAM